MGRFACLARLQIGICRSNFRHRGWHVWNLLLWKAIGKVNNYLLSNLLSKYGALLPHPMLHGWRIPTFLQFFGILRAPTAAWFLCTIVFHREISVNGDYLFQLCSQLHIWKNPKNCFAKIIVFMKMKIKW